MLLYLPVQLVELSESNLGIVLLVNLLYVSHDWEFEISSNELESVSSTNFIIRDDGSLQNVDRRESSLVSAGQFSVHLVHSTNQRNISVFFVHVVNATSAVVSDPNTVVFDLSGVFFNDFSDVQNFTVGLLHFVHSGNKVPESRLGNNCIGSENFHSKNGGRFSFLGWFSSGNNDVVFVLKKKKCYNMQMFENINIIWTRKNNEFFTE